MCGIFGGVGVSKFEATEGIDLINRGNDGITISQLEENLIFAARRHLVKKSGIDSTEKSDQPYFSEDKKIALIFNGEFYNFQDYKRQLLDEGKKFISTGDTEVLLKLYEKSGIKFLLDRNIDSLFSLAIFDKKKNKIFIARDWPGRIPLYYFYDSNRFIFSSELKAFKSIKNISLQDPIELKPGSYVEYDLVNKKLNNVEYFKPNNSLINKSDEIQLIGKNIHNLLDDSSKNRTMGDVPICTMLSGGIDSVLTTFYVFKNLNFKKIGYQPTSYVFSVKGFDSPDVKKARIARDSFKKSIDLKLVEVEAAKQEIVNDVPGIVESFEMRKLKALSFYPLPIYWFLAPRMREDGFKVTIGGHGVDELLGAYDSWKELNKPHEVQIRSASRLFFINNIYNNMLKRASIIFMNRGPIEARFPFLNPKVCEYLLSIDKKWLFLNNESAHVMLNLIDMNKSPKLEKIYRNLEIFINNPSRFYELPESDIYDLKKIFWKLPLIVSSYIASKESFLEFDQVFNPKLRGQHGAGITALEKDVVNKYSKLGNSDTEIFKNLASKVFS